MDWDLKYNGTSIKDVVSSVKQRESVDTPIHEIDIELIDQVLYRSIDWTRIPSGPQLELFEDRGSGWQSLGRYYIERPTYSANPDVRGLRGIWGRSSVAALAEPYARTITKTWTQQTFLFDIIDEVLEGSGISLDRNQCTIPNFVIYPLTYSADKAYPIDIVMELAELCGVITLSDHSGSIFLQTLNFHPTTADFTLTDDDIIEYSEELIFPEFKNRVKISADNASSGYSLECYADTQCVSTRLPGEEEKWFQVYARLSDDSDAGVNDVPIDWKVETGLVSLKSGVTNTKDMTIPDEKVTSDGFFFFDLKFPPKQILSVYAEKDTQRDNNFASGGYSIDGRRVTLTDKLDFCDQKLIVTYKSSGIASNTFKAGPTYGNDTITASIAGARAKVDIYIGNPCKCSSMDVTDGGDGGGGTNKPTYGLFIEANPKKICGVVPDPYFPANEQCTCQTPGCISQIIVAADEYQAVEDGRLVEMREVVTDTEPHGELEWKQERLGSIPVEGIASTIEEETGGLFRCSTPYYFDSSSIDAEWRPTKEAAWRSATIDHLDGKNIFLFPERDMAIGMEVQLSGTILGAAINFFKGKLTGTAKIQASVQGVKEEPMTAEIDIEITADGSSSSPGGSGGSGGSGGGGGKPPYNPNTPAICQKADGTKAACAKGEVCCTDRNGVKGCFKQDECNAKNCVPSDCSKNPDDKCLSSRFGAGLQAGCKCEDMCAKEFDKYWTTQDYDKSSYKRVSDIVESVYHLSNGSPAYWEKFEELKKEAISACKSKCGDCGSTTSPTIAGPDAVTAPGGYLYSAGGGAIPYTWSVARTQGQEGITISGNGFVTLPSGACGSFVVTVTDKCGKAATRSVRITNAGVWVKASTVSCPPISSSGCTCGGWPGACSIPDEIIGGTKTVYLETNQCRCCTTGSCNQGPPSGGCKAYLIGSALNNLCWSECGQPERTDHEAAWYCYATKKDVYEWRCNA
jgi:hypothetical protein